MKMKVTLFQSQFATSIIAEKKIIIIFSQNYFKCLGKWTSFKSNMHDESNSPICFSFWWNLKEWLPSAKSKKADDRDVESKQSREAMIVWNFYTYRRQKCRGRTIWNPRVEEQQGAEDHEGTRISKCYHPWSHAGTICSSQPASSETFRLETSQSLSTRPLRTFKDKQLTIKI